MPNHIWSDHFQSTCCLSPKTIVWCKPEKTLQNLDGHVDICECSGFFSCVRRSLVTTMERLCGHPGEQWVTQLWRWTEMSASKMISKSDNCFCRMIRLLPFLPTLPHLYHFTRWNFLDLFINSQTTTRFPPKVSFHLQTSSYSKLPFRCNSLLDNFDMHYSTNQDMVWKKGYQSKAEEDHVLAY